MTKRTIFFLSVLLLCLPLALFALANFNFIFSSKVIDHEKGSIKISVVVTPDHFLYRDQLAFTPSQGNLEIKWAESEHKTVPFENKQVDVYSAGTHEFIIKVIPESQPIEDLKLTLDYQGCSTETCFMPSSKTFDIKFNQPVKVQPPLNSTDQLAQITQDSKQEPARLPQIEAQVDTVSGTVNFSQALQDKGIYWVLLLAFIGGLLVSLTPCVYPMIPITLSIIGSRDEKVADLMKKYSIVGLPTLIFIDTDGNEMTQLRALGDIQTSMLEKKLKQALSH